MLLTEEQARRKWCVLAVAPADDQRTHTQKCIASECMAWRWHNTLSVDNPSGVPGMANQQIKHDQGFCGLAGGLK